MRVSRAPTQRVVSTRTSYPLVLVLLLPYNQLTQSKIRRERERILLSLIIHFFSRFQGSYQSLPVHMHNQLEVTALFSKSNLFNLSLIDTTAGFHTSASSRFTSSSPIPQLRRIFIPRLNSDAAGRATTSSRSRYSPEEGEKKLYLPCE